MNSAKSATIFFTRKIITRNSNFFKVIRIFLAKCLISTQDFTQIPNLQYHKHIIETLSKTKCVTDSIQSLLAWNSHLSVKNKLLLFKLLIYPVITYDLAVYRSAFKTQLKRIQIFQKHELQRYVKPFPFAHNDVVHRDQKILLLFSAIKKLASFTVPSPMCRILY